MTRLATLLCLVFVSTSLAAPGTPNQSRSDVKMFGGLILPYSGQVRTEVAFNPADPEGEMLIAVSVKAPSGFQCDEVGWEFSVSPFALPTIEKSGKQEDGSVYWSRYAHTEIHIVGEMLCIEILTEKELHRFVLRYDERLMNLGAVDRASSDANGLPIWTVVSAPAPRGECPGGTCSCGAGLCNACCSEGYHPSCKNCRRNSETCTCFINRRSRQEAELQEYEVVPIDPTE